MCFYLCRPVLVQQESPSQNPSARVPGNRNCSAVPRDQLGAHLLRPAQQIAKIHRRVQDFGYDILARAKSSPPSLPAMRRGHARRGRGLFTARPVRLMRGGGSLGLRLVPTTTLRPFSLYYSSCSLRFRFVKNFFDSLRETTFCRSAAVSVPDNQMSAQLC